MQDVIRPQFYIPIITLLRNAVMNSLEYKQEVFFDARAKYRYYKF